MINGQVPPSFLMNSSSVAELATRISRVIISESKHTRLTSSWTPSLEQALHRLRCRDSLSPPLVARVIDPFLLTHHSLALGFFNWASQQPGFSHTSLTYQSILKTLSLSRQFNAIDNLLRQVKSQKICLHSSVYRSVIASLIRGRKTHNAFMVFSEVASMSHEIGPKTCNSLLAALASDGYLEYAHKVFDEMILRGVPLSTFGFGVFIWRFCRNTDLGEVLSMIDEVRRGNSKINGSVIAILVIHGLCEASRESEAFWVLDELRNRDCKPDFMAYWIVAEKTFRSTSSVVDRDKILKMKRKLGVAPRSNDYREYIFSLVSERRICEAKELGEVIVKGNFPIEDDVLNVLVGSAAMIDPGSAMVFFKFMVGKERFPTLLTLSNLSRNLCKHHKIEEMLEVFQDLCLHDYFKDLESYNVQVSFLCKAGKVKEAYEVLQEMKKKGLAPDVSFYNSVMEACCRDDLIRPAKKLWDEMFVSGCAGNLTTYNILIRKLSGVGEVEEAHRLFHHMFEKGVKPDKTTYVSLLEGLCQERKLEDAIQVFSKSVEQDIMLARTVLSSFILCLCKAGSFLAASELLRNLTIDINHSDAHVTFMKGLADAGDVPLAIAHIDWMRENSPSTLQVTSSELLALLSSSSKPEPILQILRTIKKMSSIQQ